MKGIVKIEAPEEVEIPEETKIPEKTKIPKEEKTPEIIEDIEMLEIHGKAILIKISNDLSTITKVRKILEVYEEELRKDEIHVERTPTSPQLPILSELPQLPTLPEIIEEQKKVEVKPYEHYVICPLCAGKLKKKKLRKEGDMLKQRVFCKNKRCGFERIYEFSI